jgi:DNA-binding GntR family transcriptional regulator
MHVKNIQLGIYVVYQMRCRVIVLHSCTPPASKDEWELPVANGRRKVARGRPGLGSPHMRHASSAAKLPIHPMVSTLAERVYQQLKTDIIHGVFQPGEAINEKVLAHRYEGSRTPVREAIMRLQQENLLRLVPQKGYFVSHLTIHELNEMYEYRAELEGFCAELAARRWTDATRLESLAELAQTQYKTEDRKTYEYFIEADTEFHIGVAQLTHNRLLVRAVKDIRCQMERIMFASIDIGYYGEVPAREHTDIVEAIRKRAPAAARQAMYDHIVGSKEKVLRLAAGR